MAGFQNHRRFSLRCLSIDVIPVSIRLKSNIKTPKGCHIIKKAEKALLNERIRSINNTINMLSHQRDTCKTDLERRVEEETMEECNNFIKTRREARHFKTIERQKRTIERLCHKNSLGKGDHSDIQHGNHTVTSMVTASNSNLNTKPPNKWVLNISDKQLTKAKEDLLAHGPNYAVVPRNPPITEYVAALEQACTKLKQGEAEELRGEIRAVMKKIHTPT